MYPKLAIKHVLINVYTLGGEKKLQMVTMVNYMLHIFYHIKKKCKPHFLKLVDSRNFAKGLPLMVQWLRICRAMQGTRVPSSVGELRSQVPHSN